MELLGGWIREVVILLVFIVFLELLIPRSSVENFVRVVAGLLILVTILKPVVMWIHDFHPMEISWKDTSRGATGHTFDPPAFLEAAYEQGLRHKIMAYLSEKGYDKPNVAVTIRLDTDAVVVNSVIVTLECIPTTTLKTEICSAFDLPSGAVSIIQGGKRDEGNR